MIERWFSVQDMLFMCCVLFLIVKLIQRKEGWGWKRNK